MTTLTSSILVGSCALIYGAAAIFVTGYYLAPRVLRNERSPFRRKLNLNAAQYVEFTKRWTVREPIPASLIIAVLVALVLGAMSGKPMLWSQPYLYFGMWLGYEVLVARMRALAVNIRCSQKG